MFHFENKLSNFHMIVVVRKKIMTVNRIIIQIVSILKKMDRSNLNLI